MNFNIRRPAVVGLSLLCASAQAAPLAVDDAVPPFSAQDQHGIGYQFTNGAQFLLVATEMGCGNAANHKLAEQGAGCDGSQAPTKN